MGGRGCEFSHARLWAAIDAIADHHGLSPSALARRAGLDSTAFNKSKRIAGDGRLRWPSTESIAKVLDATGFGLDDFVRLIGPCGATAPAHRAVPLLAATPPPGFAEGDGPVTAALPASTAIAGPRSETAAVFAVEAGVFGGAPFYRGGDVLVAATTARMRKGDRVLICRRDGHIAVATFVRRSRDPAEAVAATGAEATRRLPPTDVLWIARILRTTR